MNIRSFNDRDLYQVLDLMSKNYHRPYTKEWWEWKYKKNPFGQSIIWVSENDNKIVGIRSFWAWRLQFRGNIYKVYQPVDTLVDESYRGQGLFTKMTLNAISEAKENGAIMLFNFPNNNSLLQYLKLGWQLIDDIHWYIKISNISKLVSFNPKRSNRIIIPNNSDICYPEALESSSIRKTLFYTQWTNDYLRWRFSNNVNHRYRIECTGSIVIFYSIYKYKGVKELLILNATIDQYALNRAIDIANHIAAYIAVPAISGSKKEEMLRKNGFRKINKHIHFVVLPLENSMKSDVLDKRNWDIGLENIDTF